MPPQFGSTTSPRSGSSGVIPNHLDLNMNYPASLCHGWGAGAVPLTTELLLGITPTKPGFTEIKLACSRRWTDVGLQSQGSNAFRAYHSRKKWQQRKTSLHSAKRNFDSGDDGN